MSRKRFPLADGASVHDLHYRESAVRLNACHDRRPGTRLLVVADAGLEDVALRECLVGVDAFRDYQAEAAARKALVVARHRLGRPAIFRRRDAGHGGNAEPILESAAFYINRRGKWGFHVDLQSSVVSDAAMGSR